MNQKTEYFHQVYKLTQTRLWINNATPEEAGYALAAGAWGASTNPTYAAKLPADYLNRLIDNVLECRDNEDEIAEQVYQDAVRNLQEVFMPLYVKTKGQYGHVAIQGDPRVNHDSDVIIEGALRYYKEMDENIIVKVPATPAGAIAMEKLTSMNLPSIATLGFSVDQAIYMAQAYHRGLKKAKTKPVCYIVFIAGILEDYLKSENKKKGNVVPVEIIEQAGNVGHRNTFKIFKERNYVPTLIGGGARGPHHFVDIVGGDQAITIGWNLADQLLKEDPQVVSKINAATPKEVIDVLTKNFPDYPKSFKEGSMSPGEFVDFGPVKLFQSAFINGVDKLLKIIQGRKVSKVL